MKGWAHKRIPILIYSFWSLTVCESIDPWFFPQRRAGCVELDLQRQWGKLNSQGRLALTWLMLWPLILRKVIMVIGVEDTQSQVTVLWVWPAASFHGHNLTPLQQTLLGWQNWGKFSVAFSCWSKTDPQNSNDTLLWDYLLDPERRSSKPKQPKGL